MFSKWLALFFLLHILGDFYFQTEKTAKEKSEKIGAVIKHSVVYGIVTIVPCSMFVNGKILLVLVALSIAHGLIDIVKYFAVKPKRNRETRIFILDQILHVACIILAAFALHFVTGDVDLPQLVYEVTSVIGISFFDLVRWTALILFACKPSGILIQSLINNFKPEIATTHEEIKNAGRTIGYLERLIIIILMAMNQYAAIGLVITAKSIARYEQLSTEKAFAEYYLLGTLLSLLTVISTGLLFLRYLG